MKKTQIPHPLFSDRIMADLHDDIVKRHGPFEELSAGNPESYFWELCESIIGQQLSEKVAPIIRDRVKLVLQNDLTPEKVLRTDTEELRGAGLSYAKISYIKNVATAWQSGQVKPEKLSEMSDEAVITTLTEIKGVGRWTAEMFLMFRLGRPDIFSTGDYALKKALIMVYKLPPETKPKDLLKIADQWQPHRSIASRALWRFLDTPTEKKE